MAMNVRKKKGKHGQNEKTSKKDEKALPWRSNDIFFVPLLGEVSGTAEPQ